MRGLAGGITPGQEATVEAVRDDGSRTEFAAVVRIDGPAEVDVFRRRRHPAAGAAADARRRARPRRPAGASVVLSGTRTISCSGSRVLQDPGVVSALAAPTAVSMPSQHHPVGRRCGCEHGVRSSSSQGATGRLRPYGWRLRHSSKGRERAVNVGSRIGSRADGGVRRSEPTRRIESDRAGHDPGRDAVGGRGQGEGHRPPGPATDFVVRYQGGNNAGHTIMAGGPC